MATFVALLRGINVAGKGKLRMAALREACEARGLTNVATYLQSGNIVFDCKLTGTARVAAMVEGLIESEFGLDARAIIRAPAELQRIVKTNPFASDARKDPTKVHATFLASRPSTKLVRQLELVDTRGDALVVSHEEVLLHCPNGYGRTKLNNVFLERQLEVVATTRNWKTVEALHGMVT